jgi:hypothetical protein
MQNFAENIANVAAFRDNGIAVSMRLFHIHIPLHFSSRSLQHKQSIGLHVCLREK